MAPKRARIISYGNDQSCHEVKKFIEGAGILLEIRNLEQKPLTVRELTLLIGHLSMNHFVDETSDSFKKNGLDKEMPERKEMIQMMSEDYTLIRKPIIQSNRLITIGCDKKKLMEMLQISPSGELIYVQPPKFSHNGSSGKDHRKKKVSAGSGR